MKQQRTLNLAPMIAELKKKHGYDDMNHVKYYQDNIKYTILSHILRVKHRYFYLCYDSAIAVFVILLASLVVYWYGHDKAVIAILAPCVIFNLTAIFAFGAVAGQKYKQLEKETEKYFQDGTN